MSGARRAIYPGSFDPVTFGHMDIIRRAAASFDDVVVAVLRNTNKAPLFSAEERREMLEEAIAEAGLGNVRVSGFEGLLVDFARNVEAKVVLRGLRAVSDFEYELQMALLNRRLAPEVETLFLTPAEQYTYISSGLVREIAALGGDVSEFVHPVVEQALRSKFG